MSQNTEAVIAAQPLADTGPQIHNDVPPLHMLYLYLSEGCNLACQHCWIAPLYDPQGKHSKFMSLDHVRSSIEQAIPLGLASVKLTGGEPTLHPQFREVVTDIRDRGIRIAMESNGLLIDESLADFLAEKGLGFISISLDGATAKTHDFLRGVAGSFELTQKAIQNLVERGIRPQMICTLHKENVGEAEALVELANQLNCASVKFNMLQSIGRGEKFADRFGIELPQLLEYARWLQDEVNRNSDLVVLVDIPLAFRTIYSLVARRPATCDIHHILGVLATGHLSLCGIGYQIPELIYGHLDHDDLAEIWKNDPRIQELRHLIPKHLEGICSSCMHRDMCQGTCVANNYNQTHRINAPYMLCEQAAQMGLFPQSRLINHFAEG